MLIKFEKITKSNNSIFPKKMVVCKAQAKRMWPVRIVRCALDALGKPHIEPTPQTGPIN